MKMKKFIAVLATVGMVAALAAGCGSGDDASADKGTKTGSASSDWDSSNDITIVSREDGSGTRGAFVELFGIQQEVDGEKVDMTTVDAQVTNNTSVMKDIQFEQRGSVSGLLNLSRNLGLFTGASARASKCFRAGSCRCCF